jgi:hypothetical protein
MKRRTSRKRTGERKREPAGEVRETPSQDYRGLSTKLWFAEPGFVVFGDSSRMPELPDESVHLIVTSPPYFNAPFDYPGLFPSYQAFLDLMEICFKEWYRVLAPGRVAAIVCDDTLINKRGGVSHPSCAQSDL